MLTTALVSTSWVRFRYRIHGLRFQYRLLRRERSFLCQRPKSHQHKEAGFSACYHLCSFRLSFDVCSASLIVSSTLFSCCRPVQGNVKLACVEFTDLTLTIWAATCQPRIALRWCKTAVVLFCRSCETKLDSERPYAYRRYMESGNWNGPKSQKSLPLKTL